MATTTTKLGLTKPATTENYNVAVFNNNADLVDTAFISTACGFTPSTNVSIVVNNSVFYGYGLKLCNLTVSLAFSIVLGTEYTLGTLDVGCRPTSVQYLPSYYGYWFSGYAYFTGKIKIDTNGVVSFIPQTSMTYTQGATYQIEVAFTSAYI